MKNMQTNDQNPNRDIKDNFTENIMDAIGSSRKKSHHAFLSSRGLKHSKHFTLGIIGGLVVLAGSTAVYAAPHWQQLRASLVGEKKIATMGIKEYDFTYSSCTSLGSKEWLGISPQAAKKQIIRLGTSSSVSLSSDELMRSLKARCEIVQAETLYTNEPAWQDTASRPTVIDSSDIRTITLGKKGTLQISGLSNPISKNVVVYANGQKIAASDLKTGDRVIAVLQTSKTASNTYVGGNIIGLIKVATLPADRALADKTFEIRQCVSNNSTCLELDTQATATQPLSRSFVTRQAPTNYTQLPELQGRVTQVTEQGITFQAFESNQKYIIALPATHRDQPVRAGDMIGIVYQKNQHTNNIISERQLVNAFTIKL